MSSATLLILAAAGWLAVGVVVSLVMGRRGHDASPWLRLGVLFGPLTALFAWEAWRDERLEPELVSRRQLRGGGPVDLLVGFDTSAESQAALAAAQELLGSRLGRVTLATVVPYDGADEDEAQARDALQRQGAVMAGSPRLELLHGRPSQALLERAVADGYDVLAIGTKGAGASNALLGSTAVDLARSAPMPVLLVGSGGPLPDPVSRAAVPFRRSGARPSAAKARRRLAPRL